MAVSVPTSLRRVAFAMATVFLAFVLLPFDLRLIYIANILVFGLQAGAVIWAMTWLVRKCVELARRPTRGSVKRAGRRPPSGVG